MSKCSEQTNLSGVMTMLTINDLPAFNELATREMSAVRGGSMCVDIAGAVKRANDESGVTGAIQVVALCLGYIGRGAGVCGA
jgi:hypothetical protein